MVAVELTQTESDALYDQLSQDLAAMVTEIRHTDNHAYRDRLRARRDALQAVLLKMDAERSSPSSRAG